MLYQSGEILEPGLRHAGWCYQQLALCVDHANTYCDLGCELCVLII